MPSARLATTVALLLTLATAPGLAQESEDTEPAPRPANTVSADLSLGVLGIAYERVLADYVSLALAAQYFSPWYQLDGVAGFGGELRAHVFPQGIAPEGAYILVAARGAWLATSDEPVQRQGFAMSARLAVGWSVLLDSFFLRIGLGAQYQVIDLEDPAAGPVGDFADVIPVADLFAGAAF